MTSPGTYRLLADIVLVIHFAFVAFVVIGLVVRPFLNRYAWVSGILLIIALAAALALSVLTLDAVIRSGEPHFEGRQWLDVGGAVIELALLIDPLTAIMLVVVTGVSLMVQIYSLGYMRGDPSYARYFAYMALFTASMLGLVLSANSRTYSTTWSSVLVAM